jgi:hypothetical protein
MFEPRKIDGTRALFTFVYTDLRGSAADIWTCLRSAENIENIACHKTLASKVMASKVTYESHAFTRPETELWRTKPVAGLRFTRTSYYTPYYWCFVGTL